MKAVDVLKKVGLFLWKSRLVWALVAGGLTAAGVPKDVVNIVSTVGQAASESQP
jgi:hypothetical protein